MTNCITITDLLKQGANKQQIRNEFERAIKQVDKQLNLAKLITMFNYALDNNTDLFPKIKLSQKLTNSELPYAYCQRWIDKYLQAKQKGININLKLTGEHDPAMVALVKSALKVDDATLEKYLTGFFACKSAVDLNGNILEDYLASVLEPIGWYRCNGAIYRAVDFCYLHHQQVILLQVKNKYNTENSSSSAIRNGTKIIKWNRLKKPCANDYSQQPQSNWSALQAIVNNKIAEPLLTDEKYLDYINQQTMTNCTN